LFDFDGGISEFGRVDFPAVLVEGAEVVGRCEVPVEDNSWMEAVPGAGRRIAVAGAVVTACGPLHTACGSCLIRKPFLSSSDPSSALIVNMQGTASVLILFTSFFHKSKLLKLG